MCDKRDFFPLGLGLQTNLQIYCTEIQMTANETMGRLGSYRILGNRSLGLFVTFVSAPQNVVVVTQN